MTSDGVDQSFDLISKQIVCLDTEARNPATTDLDQMTPGQIIAAMNAADAAAVAAVQTALPDIEKAIVAIAAARTGGGRLIYLGAGTSGRLGLLDAVECAPTFGIAEGEVVGLIAGGYGAFVKAVEGAEDDRGLAVEDLNRIRIDTSDVIVGLAASGRTPYVIGGLDHARQIGAGTVAVSCNRNAEASQHADIAIEVPTGPEILTGSTRLKAGTATKMVCNMLTTAAMVLDGRTFHNLMVDLRPTNEKLLVRARRIVAEATGATPEEAAAALEEAGFQVKAAIVMLLCRCDKDSALARLANANGHTRQALT